MNIQVEAKNKVPVHVMVGGHIMADGEIKFLEIMRIIMNEKENGQNVRNMDKLVEYQM